MMITIEYTFISVTYSGGLTINLKAPRSHLPSDNEVDDGVVERAHSSLRSTFTETTQRATQRAKEKEEERVRQNPNEVIRVCDFRKAYTTLFG